MFLFKLNKVKLEICSKTYSKNKPLSFEFFVVGFVFCKPLQTVNLRMFIVWLTHSCLYFICLELQYSWNQTITKYNVCLHTRHNVKNIIINNNYFAKISAYIYNKHNLRAMWACMYLNGHCWITLYCGPATGSTSLLDDPAFFCLSPLCWQLTLPDWLH